MGKFGNVYSRPKILVISPLLNDNLDRLVCERGHLHDFPHHVETCNIAVDERISREERRRLIEEVYAIFEEEWYKNNLRL